MKNGDDDDPILVRVVEDRVREPVQKNAPEGAVDELKPERPFSGEKKRSINGPDKIVG